MLRCFVSLFTITFLASVSLGQSVVINVDVQGGGTPRDAVTGDAAAHADPAGAAAVWNVSGLNGAALTASDGSASTVGYTFGSNDAAGAGDPRTFRQQDDTGQTNLLYDYAFANSNANLLLDVTGLDPLLTYDLYIYGSMQFNINGNATIDFTVGGNTESTVYTGVDENPNIQTDYFLNENYVLFTGLTGTSQSVSIARNPNIGFAEPTVAGFALVGTPAVIPEPSSLAILACFGTVVASRRRKRVA